ncbi:hypothetical protein VTJ83DRAFT_5865 [Remersonia thermophila]|uniref:Replication factor A protein 3 n=1 Tax=Remersonia thermophila TaxID=72144 RepID=A0ABR4D822_9PEZI
MEAIACPRVTSVYLNNYVGKNVTIVGKVLELRGEEALIDADGNVTAHLDREAHLMVNNGVQIIGKVQPDLSIKVLNSIDLGTNVDYSLANKVVEISHQHPSLFHYD